MSLDDLKREMKIESDKILDDMKERRGAWKDFEEFNDVIPWLSFPAHWKVRIIPPFGGAVIRFTVQKTEDKWISIYLDCRQALGFFGGFRGKDHYWEVYPAKYRGDEDWEYEDIARFHIDDTETLMRCIQSQLDDKFWDDEKNNA